MPVLIGAPLFLELLSSALLLGLAGLSTAAVIRKALDGSTWMMLPVPAKLRSLVDQGRACDACSSAWAVALVTGAALAAGALALSWNLILVVPAGAGVAYRLLRTPKVDAAKLNLLAD